MAGLSGNLCCTTKKPSDVKALHPQTPPSWIFHSAFFFLFCYPENIDTAATCKPKLPKSISTNVVKMRCCLLLACMALIPAAWSAPGYTQQNGRTRLIGSSFGVLGINATFDYVVRRCLVNGLPVLKILLIPPKIIGGGTSGLTVANRLAANPALSVAVIEGGGFYEIDNGNISQIPGFDAEYSSSSPTTIQPLVDWGIVTVPQTVRIPFRKDSTASTVVVQ